MSNQLAIKYYLLAFYFPGHEYIKGTLSHFGNGTDGMEGLP